MKPLKNYYLLDEAELKARQEAVANQAKVKVWLNDERTAFMTDQKLRSTPVFTFADKEGKAKMQKKREQPSSTFPMQEIIVANNTSLDQTGKALQLDFYLNCNDTYQTKTLSSHHHHK